MIRLFSVLNLLSDIGRSQGPPFRIKKKSPNNEPTDESAIQ